MSAFSDRDKTNFMLGERMTCDSSYVASAEYVASSPGIGSLILEFKDGVRCKYDNVTWEMVASFADAPSKGKWRHANFPKGYPYTIV